MNKSRPILSQAVKSKERRENRTHDKRPLRWIEQIKPPFRQRFLTVSDDAILEKGVPIGQFVSVGDSLMLFSADPRLARLDGMRFPSSKKADRAVRKELKSHANAEERA